MERRLSDKKFTAQITYKMVQVFLIIQAKLLKLYSSCFLWYLTIQILRVFSLMQRQSTKEKKKIVETIKKL